MTAERCSMIQKGLDTWDKLFNPRQLLTLVTYVEIINEAKSKLQIEYEPEKVKAIATYLALVLDRCVDKNARLCIWDSGRSHAQRATTQHALNLTWNYPEFSGSGELWEACADAVISDYQGLCNLFGTKSNSSTIPGLDQHDHKSIQIDAASADSLFHIPDNSVDTIITDPPYYSTIQYAELADFFYVWQKRTLGDIFPDLFYSELTDKDREAVAPQLALAVGGFDVNDLAKTYKLIAAKSGNCTIFTPKQRHKKRAFSADADDFSNLYLVDALHAIIAIYQEEQNPQLVRNFMQKTGLNNNDMLMKTLEIAFKVMPTKTEEHKTLTSIWLSMDEIKAKVVYEQTKLSL